MYALKLLLGEALEEVGSFGSDARQVAHSKLPFSSTPLTSESPPNLTPHMEHRSEIFLARPLLADLRRGEVGVFGDSEICSEEIVKAEK